VPTPDGAIVPAGLTRAFEGAPQRSYDQACDCIKDAKTGQTWTADDHDGLFIDAKGEHLAPLLIASFAFNFNNFNAIFMVSEGGPFPPDNSQIGATDLLITYTYRLAFGAQGAQYGFAAAVSVFIFLIVAVFSIIGFRRTRALEEVN
jgi:hypothetical protein